MDAQEERRKDIERFICQKGVYPFVEFEEYRKFLQDYLRDASVTKQSNQGEPK